MASASPLAAQSVVEIPAEDRNLNPDFEEVFRIGSIAGEAWETFSEVSQAAFDASGNLYVFDRQGDRITVVDAEGNFIREVGGAGQGPGEFNMAVSFTAMPDGSLVVADIDWGLLVHLVDHKAREENVVADQGAVDGALIDY